MAAKEALQWKVVNIAVSDTEKLLFLQTSILKVLRLLPESLRNILHWLTFDVAIDLRWFCRFYKLIGKCYLY
jgi:hypothetical protein